MLRNGHSAMVEGQSTAQESGYASLGQVLDDVAIVQARELVTAVIGEDRLGGCERHNNRLVPLRWNDPLVDLLLSIEPFVASVARATFANDLKWISGYVSIRERHTGPLAWHQDWWCWDHSVSFRAAATQVVVACYLDGLLEEKAALRVVPGSHSHSSGVHASMDEDGVAAIDAEGGVLVTTRPGDAVVMDYRLVHGTTANASDQDRFAVLLSFAPDWGGLPTEIQGHLVSHLALPSRDEEPPRTGWRPELLPTFAGVRRDLTLNRRPPARFGVL